MSGFWGALAQSAGSSVGGGLLDFINPGQYIGLGQKKRQEAFAQKQAGIETGMAREQLDLAKLLGKQEYDMKEDDRNWRRDFRTALGRGA